MNVFSDLTQKDKALFHAIDLMDLKAVEEALANGADVNVINDLGGDSPLQSAEREGYAEIIKLLIDNGARIDVFGKYTNETILHSAVTNKHIEIVKLLLARGADVNVQDKYLETPLHKAAHFECIAIAQLLIENGADVNAINKFGETTLYKAIKSSYFQGIRSVKMVELLLDHGVGVNAIVCDEKKLTPLLWAVIERQKEIVKLLLKRGADRKAVDIDGNTALYWAKYDPEIALLL
jgi:ankyrin repeat protein